MTTVSRGDGNCSTLPCGALLLYSSSAQMLPAGRITSNERMEAESGTEQGLCMLDRESTNSKCKTDDGSRSQMRQFVTN